MFKQSEIGLIPEDWKVIRLDEKTSITMGQSPPSCTYNVVGDGLPFFQGRKDFGSRNPAITTWCSEPKKKAKKGEILLSVRAPIGDINISNNECCIGRGLSALSWKNGSNEFLFYLLKHNGKRLKSTFDSEGTVFGCVSKGGLSEFLVAIPETEKEQTAITKIPLGLDSKIELNQQMNKTLEAVSQAIFKRWFVDFEFPNEEGKPYKSHDGKMMDSELGEIPAGWTVGCLGDIADSVGNPVRPENVKPDTPYIGLEHMPRKSIALAEWGHVEDVSSNKSSFHRENILFGKLRPYFHKVGVAPIDGICSTDILVVTVKQPEFLGMVLFHLASDELVKYADMTSSGTKMPRTSWSDLAQYRILIPSEEIMRDFTSIIYPMVEKIIGNVLQSQTLVRMRDSLLPKLMSGKIRVPIPKDNGEA